MRMKSKHRLALYMKLFRIGFADPVQAWDMANDAWEVNRNERIVMFVVGDFYLSVPIHGAA